MYAADFERIQVKECSLYDAKFRCEWQVHGWVSQ